ncbi:uncharacterized protein PHALS_10865 [Plasmopara halstedii]|uniref:Uncharacterized protein n=1 Tax=Plasmopara halstedii TaxID=4781 RepID=A0A0P1AIN5_PLAHL|nr:uncharacterized protein PHALS_10865 [Plasmopara halstedii]CEG40679.1 hypothetical protein PHALS_10865 [Plasmopara halstedii]|eukprot:XP_024577048.1 hypothetical protein PHALS_10865 [Plasmopara halstedii]
MSSVELPLVTSARSSDSSASSTRDRIHSASSTCDKRTQSVRSQHSQENNHRKGKNNSESRNEELWNELESFLSSPSPTFTNIFGKGLKVSGKKPPLSELPLLIQKRDSDNQATRPNRSACAPIDSKLLQEAFAYVDQLEQTKFDESNEEEQQQSSKSSKGSMMLRRIPTSSSASSHALSNLSHERRGIASMSGSKVRKKLSVYSVTAKPKVASRKSRSTREDTRNTNGHMDPQTLQALVSNFQNGTTIDELRRELTASQQSLTASCHILKEAAQKFYHGLD